ncbi:hypothetical protein CMV_011690 [Castanea mollissima]|uniref:Ribosomal protein L27 n=1 Tax=Castanea mollissima TaxID=60419 RepID=A0A8J4VWQ8_9ROSI|nr:hypothetical protein CMV_011690 [Castanea mollissima]
MPHHSSSLCISDPQSLYHAHSSLSNSKPTKPSSRLGQERSLQRRRGRLFRFWAPFHSKINSMNFAASLCRRLSVRDLVSNVPVYNSASEVSGDGLSLMFRRWATKKSAGSTKNGRDSKPKNLGVKKFGGERVIPGNIIVRQRGTRFHPGDYVGIGKDHTLYALKEGCVKFERNKLTGRKWVHVEPKDGHVLHPVLQLLCPEAVNFKRHLKSCSFSYWWYWNLKGSHIICEDYSAVVKISALSLVPFPCGLCLGFNVISICDTQANYEANDSVCDSRQIKDYKENVEGIHSKKRTAPIVGNMRYIPDLKPGISSNP